MLIKKQPVFNRLNHQMIFGQSFDTKMTNEQPNNPLHGVKLEQMLIKLQDHYKWEGLAERIPVNCFKNDPSVKSSLKFLRKTPWAREKVENLYLKTIIN